MPINSIGSNAPVYSAMVKTQTESGETHQTGRDSRPDGDQDDSKAIKPTVNTQGQTIGTLINERA